MNINRSLTLESRNRCELKLRDERLPYDGAARLMISLGGFSLILPMTCVNVSSSGLLATVNSARLGKILQDSIPSEVITVLDPYPLQIDHEYDHLPPVLMDAILTRRQIHNRHWELGFAFRVATQDLMALLHQIVRGPREPKVRFN